MDIKELKKSLNELLKYYANDNDIIEYIKDALKSFRDYVNIVVESEQLLPIIFEKYDVLNGQEEVMRLDKARRMAHNVAISNVKLLNKFSLEMNKSLIYEGVIDDEHRYEIGNFIGDVVFAYYHERRR